MRPGHRAALAMAALLASLSLVAWRQGRAYEAVEALDDLRRELALGQAAQRELRSQIQYFTSRERIEEVAWERLGLRRPNGQYFSVPLEAP